MMTQPGAKAKIAALLALGALTAAAGVGISAAQDPAESTKPKVTPEDSNKVESKPVEAPKEKDKDGYVSLFDGKTLSGWTTADGKMDSWKVEDGAIHGSGKDSHLFSPRGDYKNFSYKADFKIADKANSGMYFRTKKEKGFPAGYEAQINSTHTDPVRTGSLYGLVKVTKMLVPPDTWFTQEVEAVGNHIVIKVNGEKVVDFIDPKNRYVEGYFAFQQHDPGSQVWIKNVKVKEMPSVVE